MRQMTRPGEIVQLTAGRGEIIFPRGARIQCHFKLTEYATGAPRLTCTGLFTQASYRGWEQLVHQYRLETRLPVAQAREKGPVESFTGRLEDDRPLILGQMVLIGAEARGLTVHNQNLLLQMVFDCQDVHIGA